MSKFKTFRITAQVTGILSCIVILTGLWAQLAVLSVIGMAVLLVDLILIVRKNRCPFCHKALRIRPVLNGEEFCPHCGCKIE